MNNYKKILTQQNSPQMKLNHYSHIMSNVDFISKINTTQSIELDSSIDQPKVPFFEIAYAFNGET